jgi:hypothetical protein
VLLVAKDFSEGDVGFDVGKLHRKIPLGARDWVAGVAEVAESPRSTGASERLTLRETKGGRQWVAQPPVLAF